MAGDTRSAASCLRHQVPGRVVRDLRRSRRGRDPGARPVRGAAPSPTPGPGHLRRRWRLRRAWPRATHLRSGGSGGAHVTTPLAGTKVLDITTSLSGPLAAGILADLGAQVIKIERPTAPDRARFVGTREGDISAMFHMANRGKRSIALDLRDPADAETARALAREADVLVENFRPGVTQRLGIDYASLSALNGRLVYVSISGFGSPRADAGPAPLRHPP